jgi:MSHA biogenesis protein MshK
MAHRLARLAALGLGALAATALAAPFADPTRPPGTSDVPASAAPAAAPRLQSVLIAPDRRIAVINGESYRLGDRFGDGRVAKISETEVVIRQGSRNEVLKLYPGSERRPAQQAEKKRSMK